jgi:hypothetical protein
VSNVLGLLNVKGLEEFTSHVSKDKSPQFKKAFDAFQIIDRHLKGDKDVMDAHEELTRAGLKEYAKL